MTGNNLNKDNPQRRGISTESLQAQLERAHAATGAVFDGVRDDQWALPTPCAAWDVRALANHLVGGYRLFAAAIAQSDGANDFGR